MGNDILKARTDTQIFIPTKKIQMTKSTQRLNSNSFQKIFGKPEEMPLKRNHTVPCIVPRSIIEDVIEENTYEQNSSPPEQQTRAQTSTQTENQLQSLLALQEQIRKLKKHLQEQNYNSRNYSPVKGEKQQISHENDINRSNTRQRRHYFRLKGCQVEEGYEESAQKQIFDY